MKRKIIFGSFSVDTIKKMIDQLPFSKETEIVSVEKAVGRVLARAYYSQLSSPPSRVSAMDGIAVDSRLIYQKSSSGKEVLLKLGKEAWWIDTGEPLPDQTNTVIPIEKIQVVEEKMIVVSASVPFGSFVRSLGEDLARGDLIVPASKRLEPLDLAGLLAGGITQVEVIKRPRIQIIPTGSELIEPGEPLEPGKVIDYNSRIVASFVSNWGGEPIPLPKLKDNLEELKATLEKSAQDHDLIVMIAGSSLGRRDLVARAVREVGELLIHGIAVKPGKPVLVGLIDNTPLIGLPGYPITTILHAELFVQRFINNFLDQGQFSPVCQQAVLKRDYHSPAEVTEFLRVKVGKVRDEIIALPLSRKKGLISSILRADGLVKIPPQMTQLASGTELRVQLYRPEIGPEKRTLMAASHDILLERIVSAFCSHYPSQELFVDYMGSQQSLDALKRREVIIAGCHLYDPETEEFNRSVLKKMFSDLEVCLVNLSWRNQGLMVRPGSNIRNLTELTRRDITFINRQKGSGTRNLFDYLLKQAGVEANWISGYEQEVKSHLAAAATVAAGEADVAFGIESAARLEKLDFIPLFRERYDLVFFRQDLDDPGIRKVLQLLTNPHFRAEVESLPGYSLTEMGTML